VMGAAAVFADTPKAGGRQLRSDGGGLRLGAWEGAVVASEGAFEPLCEL
jgi:hypothetical protein